MFVTAIKIDEYKDYIIHAYPRAGTGTHGNDYVKIKKRGELGKFMFHNNSWESGCSLNFTAKNQIERYLLLNKNRLQQLIEGLG